MGVTDNVRILDVSAKVGRADPLIAALIERLPAPATDFPADERQAWLTMMETAFTVVYGGPKGSGMTAAVTRVSRSPSRPAAAARRRSAPKGRSTPKAPRPLGPTGPRFFIDRQSFARKAGGDRIMPAEIAGILVDKRGQNGDLASITWADDSTGIPKGLQLDIGISDGQD